MISWRKQESAWVGTLSLLDGRPGNVVLVGSRRNAKGAVLVLPSGTDGQVETLPFISGTALLHPQCIVDVLSVQERAFGKSGLPAFGE